MARNTTLLRLLDKLRAETRSSLNPAHNNQVRDTQVLMLQETQIRLWAKYAWPHLRVERQMPISVGQRYYDTPVDIAVDRIEKLECFLDGAWRVLDPTLDSTAYAITNSDLGERSWPPQAWRIYEAEDIELWPVPDTAAVPATLEGYLKFTGIRNLNPLVDDSDRADLDDDMIVYFAAAEWLTDSAPKRSQVLFDKAAQVEARMTNNLAIRRTMNVFGINRPRHGGKPRIGTYRSLWGNQ